MPNRTTSPKYKRIVDELSTKINKGEWPPGFQLPTHRALAVQYKVAVMTASRVYAELESIGLVSGEVGRGTFVRETALPLSNGIDQPAVKSGLIDLNFNSSSLSGQTQLLRDGLRQLSLSGDLETLLHYQPHAGRKHERAIVAKHLKASNVNVDSEQVLIVNGAQHGLACTVMGLLSPGDVVVTDSLTYSGFKVLAQVHRLELIPIAVTAHGPDLGALTTICEQRNVRAIYTIPTMHNPLGWVLDLQQRERIVAIAEQHDLLIIEDAAYAFLAENPPPPLVTLSPNNCVYISGISKSVATGLRVGYIAAPEKWVAKIERVIRATTWNTPSIITALACHWIEDGTVITLEKEKRQDAIARQKIAKHVFASMSYFAHPNSYILWLPLPENVRADQIVMALLRENISVSNAEPFTTSDVVPHAIRIALGSVSLNLLNDALIKIRETIENCRYL
ncbi:PLP-dependent aminotransferase family protein [Marinomonas sp.]|nr:PLP-dependent aminotransferase family protein [Marinomonas sp.]MDB4837583.1 PLP-dependent aminotransferase family protein [Marinomonas sp.]